MEHRWAESIDVDEDSVGAEQNSRTPEDVQDELAVAHYQVRRQLGEVTYVSSAQARRTLGLDPQ